MTDYIKWALVKHNELTFLASVGSACRKSSTRVIEELQRTLIEVETRYKTEISRLKKKYETDIRELEGALDNANRANAEYLVSK